MKRYQQNNLNFLTKQHNEDKKDAHYLHCCVVQVQLEELLCLPFIANLFVGHYTSTEHYAQKKTYENNLNSTFRSATPLET